MVGWTIRADGGACKTVLDIVLDIEVTLNNRSLMYVEEDIQMPVLTPNTLLYGQPLRI